MAEATRTETGPLALVVFSGGFDRVHYALAIAAAALACNRPVTLFFTMEATRALARPGPDGRPGWAGLTAGPSGQSAFDHDEALRAKGIAGFEDLLAACVALGASVMVCEMGLRAIGLGLDALRDDVPLHPGGLVTFLTEIGGDGATMFI
ncbi:DsrE family protein [Magnetospirillum fulvum]|uniref:Peroxiredoxin family protein n=1 Tax=Magnetospirillum fulvum TaxID=1082 RepID=A0A1H6JPQ5_MAGFU|nr:DsrE family protein [Magnetospirillum fulvum]SEH64468.1 Peroxiredoxin family protein [Magnetospirillum fulvum]